MAQKKQTGKGGSKSGLIGLAAAAIAGAYFLYGSKEGAKRRAKVKGWMLKAKGEVLDKLETMKEVNQESYNKLVDAVTEKYGKVKNIESTELVALTADLKRHWNNIKRQMGAPGAKKPARKPAAKKRPSHKKTNG